MLGDLKLSGSKLGTIASSKRGMFSGVMSAQRQSRIGSIVHAELAKACKTNSVVIGSNLATRNYLEAGYHFFNEHTVQPLAVEKSYEFYDKHLDVTLSGVFDFVGYIDGKLYIIDWKTSPQIDLLKCTAQLTTYGHIYNNLYVGSKPNLGIVHLRRDGTYRFIAVDYNYPLLESVVTIAVEQDKNK